MDREVLIATAVGIIIAAMFTYAMYVILSSEKKA